MSKLRKITVLSLLTAISLILFVIEMQIPPITPLPGVKIGLANTVTLFVLYYKGGAAFKPIDALAVITVRVLLSGIITGSLFSLMFSFSGGVAAIAVMLLLRRTRLPVYAVSVAGAIAHNSAQLAVAVFVYGGFGILIYLPALMLGAVLSGIFTGVIAEIVIKRI